jgi:hypothetical protein
MAIHIFEFFTKRIKGSFQNAVSTVSEINRKYSKPQIKPTPMVSFSLLFLRLYLITLVVILFYKFFTIVKK